MINFKKKYMDESGFSLPELLIVMLIMGIISMFTIFSPFAARKYAVDDQSLLISDILQEARQKSLTQRETMRVEINDTKKQIRLIDENKSNTVNDDAVIKTLTLNGNVIIGTHPVNVSASNIPTASYSIPEMKYSQSAYPLSVKDQMFTLRFLKTGEVVDTGTDNTGNGAILSGATIYVYDTANNTNPSPIIRAITISGISGLVSILKCRLDSQNICSEWVK